MFMKDNSVKLGLPIALGWLPGGVAIALNFVIALIKNGSIAGSLTPIFNDVFTIVVQSSAGLAAGIGAAFLLILFIPYAVARHNQREQKLKIKKFR